MNIRIAKKNNFYFNFDGNITFDQNFSTCIKYFVLRKFQEKVDEKML